MWISRHRLDRLEQELWKLDCEVKTLQIHGYVRSDIAADSTHNFSDSRGAVPLRDVVFALANKLGIKIVVDHSKDATVRIET